MKKLLCFILSIATLSSIAQTVKWTSSNSSLVSVDQNTGTIKMLREPATTTNVTITQTTTHKGKTVTSTKTVVVDTYCSANTEAGNCCKSNNLTYCAIKLSNGQIWMDRNVGATGVAQNKNDQLGTHYAGGNGASNSNKCPSGWRAPSSAEFISMTCLLLGRTVTASTDYRHISASEMYNNVLKLPSTGTHGYYLTNESNVTMIWHVYIVYFPFRLHRSGDSGWIRCIKK